MDFFKDIPKLTKVILYSNRFTDELLCTMISKKVKKNIHSNCLIEIKYEQVNIIINERKKINRQYKIIHLEIL